MGHFQVHQKEKVYALPLLCFALVWENNSRLHSNVEIYIFTSANICHSLAMPHCCIETLYLHTVQYEGGIIHKIWVIY